MTSPCRKVCTLDESRQLCTGCWRTLDEIAGWRDYSAPQRESIMAQLASRQSAYEGSLGKGGGS